MKIPAAALSSRRMIRTSIGRARELQGWCLRYQVKVAANWQALFDGEQCFFPKRFHHILSAFALNNMRGSDKGMEMMIAGTNNSHPVIWRI